MSYLILGLPRSRTAWLSKFLTYGDWSCGHEQARHWRSLDDAKAWFEQDCTGTAETALAPFWRLLDGNVKVVLVRRPVADVVESLMALPLAFDRATLETNMAALDRKLDQIAARLDCLSVDFADLETEATCKAVFEHCLPYEFDREHWQRWAGENVQCDMRAMMRYFAANKSALDKLAEIARHQCFAALSAKRAPVVDEFTFQTETFDAWERDGAALFEAHCVQVGEAPSNWQYKNKPMMRRIYDAGAMQITTARSNGRMFGYLMTLVSPSMSSENVTTAATTLYYVDPDAGNLGLKLQRAAIADLKARGVDEVFFEASKRGHGPRLGTLYRRLGAQSHGETFRLQLGAK